MRLLAIDLGASGGRALAAKLADAGSGLKLAVEEVHRFPHAGVPVPHDGGQTWHWDAPYLWSEILAGLRKAAHAFDDVDSIGVDTWGVDYGLLDPTGRLLQNPVCYRDGRTSGLMQEAFRAVSRDEIFRRTGLQFMELNTLYQLMAQVRQDPEPLARAERLLLMPDLFHYWLCGSRTVDYTNASTTQAVGAASRDWDRDLLQRLDISAHCLPEIAQPGSNLGSLRAPIARETGLGASTAVVCPATHDTASAVVATPGEGRDWAFLSAGTWCLFGAEVERPYLDAAVLESGFSNEGGVRGTVRLLRNITGLWLVQECRRHWASEGEEYSFAELAALAAEAPPFRALLDPDDPIFLQPTRMPHAIAEYCRRTAQKAPEGIGAYVRASLEGIALTVRVRWEQLERILGRELRVLHAVGGGTQNRVLCQFIADALGRPVLAGPSEATAMGNALVQAVGLEALDYPDVRAVVRRSVELVEYRPRDRAAWDDAFGRYLALRKRAAG